MTSERTLSSRRGLKGKTHIGTGILGSLSERKLQHNKDLAALERMKELEREHLAQTEHIQLCPRSRAQLYMTPGSDYGSRLIQQEIARIEVLTEYAMIKDSPLKQAPSAIIIRKDLEHIERKTAKPRELGERKVFAQV